MEHELNSVGRMESPIVRLYVQSSWQDAWYFWDYGWFIQNFNLANIQLEDLSVKITTYPPREVVRWQLGRCRGAWQLHNMTTRPVHKGVTTYYGVTASRGGRYGNFRATTITKANRHTKKLMFSRRARGHFNACKPSKIKSFVCQLFCTQLYFFFNRLYT